MPKQSSSPTAAAPTPRSQRGRRARQPKVLTPLEQIRMRPGGITGPWGYYLRPDGATIRDALILYPNGGQPDTNRFGINAEYYRQRQAAKGFHYLGQSLSSEGVRLLVETMERNRPDEVLFCEDEIAECQYTIKNSDRPEVRDGQRRRRDQFQARLDMLLAPWDPDALVQELNDIARAQRLAGIDPNVLAVMREMIGEVNERTRELVQHFAKGKATQDPDLTQALAGGSMETGIDPLA